MAPRFATTRSAAGLGPRYGRTRTGLRILAIACAVSAVVGAQLVAAPDAQAAPPTHALMVGHALRPGQQIVSADGKVKLAVRKNGGVLEMRPHHTTWLVHGTGSAKASRATRLALHHDGVLEVTRGGARSVWRHRLAPMHVTRLTLSRSGTVQLWHGATKVATRALPQLPTAVVQPPAQIPVPVPEPVASPVADPVPSASPSDTPTPTAPPTADPIPTVTDAPVPVPVPTPIATVAVSGYSLTTAFVGGGSTINIRSAPSTSAGIAYTRSTGTAIAIVCQTVGTAFGAGTYADNRTWDQLGGADANNFVHDVLTTTPGGTRVNLSGGGYTAFSPAIPQCPGTVPAPAPAPAPAAVATAASAAAAWAAAQVGQSPYASTADAAGFSATDWGTPYGEWSGDCAKFAIVAWRHAGKQIATGDANVIYQKYLTAGMVHSGAAPAGALVFWPQVTQWGHIAISDGAGGVYTTRGTDGSRLSIQHQPLNYMGAGVTSAGWTMPF